MKKLLLLLLCAPALAQVIPGGGGSAGPASSVIGQITTSTGGAVKNGTLTFTLSQPAIASGTASVVSQVTACYTSNAGQVVGIPDPVVLPAASVTTASGTLAAGTYYVKIYYTGAGTVISAASPEISVVLSSAGSIIVSAPVLQPAAATGYGVAIGSTSGGESIQGTVTGWTAFTQAGALGTGNPPLTTNSSSCNVWFSDALVPTGTYYSVNLLNKNGSLISGFPQTWCTYGGANGTIDVSQGAPTGNCNTKGVFYPTPIFANPAGPSQSINSSMTFAGPTTLNGKTTIPSLCNSPNGPLDVVACFGADPTGVTDSTSALNGAFGSASNATRYLPAGSYKISSTLNVDTRYKVQAAASQASIFPALGFTGTLANVVSTTTQTSVVLGGMDGIFFDCRGTAAIGVLYGGPNHSVSTFGYQTSNSVMHNCTTAGAQITDEAWELSFYNVGFENNPGVGLKILDGFNMGENINCHSCDISNNGIGVMMGPATQGFAHDFYCYGCSFDFNATWGIQNQTVTTGESIVGIFGGHFETVGATQRWAQNFGRMQISGAMMGEDTSGAYPSYLIDNENYLTIQSGRDAPNGAGATLNPVQGGLTHCLAVVGMGSPNCTNFLDAGPTLGNPGGLTIGGFIAPNRFQQPAASTYAGKCAMSAGTTCTFTTAAGFTNYLAFVTLDQVSAAPATAIQAKCSLSGTTATITAGASNSLTWDCIFIGNPF